MKKLVFGVGLNDSEYPVNYVNEEGKRVVCPYYQRWCGILKRSYSPKYKVDKPSYEDVIVCEEWLKFSNFRSWLSKQKDGWNTLQLDKDLLFPNNNVYCPERCVFLPDYVNTALTCSDRNRGNFPLGVWQISVRRGVKYRAGISVKEKKVSLGRHNTPMEAHRAWQKAKIEALEITLKDYEGETYYDQRVYDALALRIDRIKEDLHFGRETFKV